MTQFIRNKALFVLFAIYTLTGIAQNTGTLEEKETAPIVPTKEGKSIVLYEDFENGMPSSWTQQYINDVDGFYATWDTRTGAGIINGETTVGEPDSAAVGNKNLVFQKQGVGYITRLITAPLDLEFIVNPELSFYHAQAQWDDGDIDMLTIYYRLGEEGEWKFLTSYMYAVETWTHRSIPLTDHETDKFYLAFEGVSGWGSGICIDELTITETGIIPKELDDLITDQASLNFMPSGSINNPILRSTIRVTGNDGELNLEEFTAHSLNTSDDDISQIKLYYTENEHFSSPQLIAQEGAFVNGTVTFENLSLELPTGYSYLWLAYDIAEDASHGNYADAYIPANGIVINGESIPVEDHNPPGRRVIYETIFYDDFDTDKGWILAGEWERDAPLGLGGSHGQPGASFSYTGNNVLGTDLTGLGDYPGDYEPDIDSMEYVAISPVMDCFYFNDVTLSFHRWLNTEFSDKVWIHVSTDGGVTWEKIWVNTNHISALGWSQKNYALTGANRKNGVRIRFAVGPTDYLNQYSGWNIDNLVITGTYITQDVGVAIWTGPDEACGMSNEETVIVKVENFGALPVNDPIPLGFSLDGGETWQMDTLYQAIPVGGIVEHTFVPKADFSVPGRYNDVIVKTFWEEDQDEENDALHHPVFSIPYITPPYSELFLQDDGLWTGYGQNNSWEWASPQGEVINEAQAGDFAWVTQAAGSYNPQEASWVESPCFNFSMSEHPAIEFYLNTHTNESADAVTIQYSTDEGLSWLLLPKMEESFTWGWYDEETTISSLQNAFGSGHGWHGDNPGWQRVRAVLGPEIAMQEKVKFRLAFASEDFDPETYPWEGIGFDAFALYEAPHDIGVYAITDPIDACELSQEQAISISIKNYGINALPAGTIIPAGMEPGTQPGAYEFFTLAHDLLPGETTDFTFNAVFDLSEPGTHTLTAFTLLPGDTDFYQPGVFNDTLVAQVNVFGYPEFNMGDDIYTTMPDTLLLDAGTGFAQYLWQDGSTEQTFQVSLPHSAFYHAMVTDSNGCSTTDTLEVITRDLNIMAITQPVSDCELSNQETISAELVNSGPDPYPAGTEIPVQLFVNGNLQEETLVELQNELAPAAIKTFSFENTFDFSVVGEYSLVIMHSLKDAAPQNDTLEQTIFVHGYPEPFIGDTIYTQDYESITLDAGEGYDQYLWQDNHDGRFYPLTNPFSAWYQVTVTDSYGCPGTDSVLVITYDIEIAEIFEPVESCELTEEEHIGVTLINHGPETFNPGSFIPLVLEYQGEFLAEDTLFIEQDWIAGQEIDFYFSAAINMQEVQSYDFSVYQKHRDTDTANDSLEFSITVHGYPDIFLPPYISSDNPENILLDPGEGYYAYLWHDGSTEPTFNVQTWGEYWVEVSNEFGCTSTAVTQVYPEMPDLAVDSVLAPVSVCANEQEVQVQVRILNSGYTIMEEGTEIIMSYTPEGGQMVEETWTLNTAMAPETTKNYTFQQTFAAPAGETHSIAVTLDFMADEIEENNTLASDFIILSLPQPHLGDNIYMTDPRDTELNPGEGFESYLWQDGSTEPVFVVQDLASAFYTVTVSDTSGCFNTDSVEVVTYNLEMDSVVTPHSHCLLTEAEEVTVKVYNEGLDNFQPGFSLTLAYGFEGEPALVVEEFVLDQSWPANSYRYFSFTQPVDLSASNEYQFQTYVATPNAVPQTDTLVSYIEIAGKPQVVLGPDIYTNQPDTIVLDAGSGFASYYWHDGNSQQTYNVSSYGWKWVRITDEYGCIGADTLYVGFYNEVRELYSEFTSKVYPNPARNLIHIDLGNTPSSAITFELMDMKGGIVLRESISYLHQLRHTVDISGLPAGVYFLNIVADTGRRTHKITILP